MAVEPKTMKDIFPEFANEANKRLQFFIDMATRRVNENVFDDKTEDAILFMAAHLLTLSNRRGKSGSVTSEKVGDLSRSYSSGSGQDSNSLKSTSYGQMFEDLMRACRKLPMVLGCRNQ